MTDETTTSTDDLFGDDAPAKPAAPADPPKAEPKPRRAARPKPAAKPKAPAEPELIDNAIRVRDIDWQCPCGNRNTHTLTACGKCREKRYTTA